ncbi:MAG: ATP-dependent DNA helicase RecG, partial [Ruminococcus sp.]|nr:ATP-dependent DNA helicase RecG [Ruminococcus sp.]
MSTLFSDIESLRGTGKVKAEKYHKLGIYSVYDLICHFPKKYFDFHCNVSVQNAVTDEYNCIKLRIVSKLPIHTTRNNLIVCKATATDGTDDI